jgi:hypothetical protein
LNFAHEWLPHTERAVHGACLISALLFGALATIFCLAKDREFDLIHTLTQTGAGAMVPIFVIVPFIPMDKDLLEAMLASWIVVSFACLAGICVTIYGVFTPYGRGNHYAPRSKPQARKPKKPRAPEPLLPVASNQPISETPPTPSPQQ